MIIAKNKSDLLWCQSQILQMIEEIIHHCFSPMQLRFPLVYILIPLSLRGSLC